MIADQNFLVHSEVLRYKEGIKCLKLTYDLLFLLLIKAKIENESSNQDKAIGKMAPFTPEQCGLIRSPPRMKSGILPCSVWRSMVLVLMDSIAVRVP